MTKGKTVSFPEFLPFGREHYRELKRRQIIRLLLTYLAPLVFLTAYFSYQYEAMMDDSRRLHLSAIAESQVNTLDLFLSERRVNLANLIDDPRFQSPPSAETMDGYLQRLRKASTAFVDIGFFDTAGVQTAYAGPYPSLAQRDYGSEPWYLDLKGRSDNFIITDIYLGFRQQPHFTIAVSRVLDGRYVVLRATLSPEKLYEYIRSIDGSQDVWTSIVNRDGYYQLVTEHIGTPLETSSFVPPDTPRLGADRIRIAGARVDYAYSWLRTADWALIAQPAHGTGQPLLSGTRLRMLGVAGIFVLAGLAMSFYRAQRIVEAQIETDKTRAQLEHAAKLASVGELAAGIAHEINNPLAVISEEAGLIKDLLDPQFEETISPEEIQQRLGTVQQEAYRCRDITRKLLRFVRRSDLDLKPHHVHDLIDSVVDGLLGPEIAVSNVELVKQYGEGIPEIITDRNQLQQVILNIVNNAVDAIGAKRGTITITTQREGRRVRLALSDTGKGMSANQLDKIFLPFYTTKEVGKGTGLGLSVSYGIVKSLGGEIQVESRPRQGSTFTIILPTKSKPVGGKS